MPKTKSINLLPQEEFDSSILGRTLKWAMGSFRIIVIVTEMIVMGAFLSRFWLDAQNSNLGDSIKIAEAQITAQADFEKEFRNIQQKLVVFKGIESGDMTATRVGFISSSVPAGVILSSISTQDKSAQIKGSSGTEINIAQYVANLKADKTIKKVDIDSVGSNNDNSSIAFLLNVSY